MLDMLNPILDPHAPYNSTFFYFDCYASNFIITINVQHFIF